MVAPIDEQEHALRKTPHDVAAGVGGFGAGFDFISSVVAGLLVGLGLDWLFDTRPWFTIVFIVLGFVAGFYRLYAASAHLEEEGRKLFRGI